MRLETFLKYSPHCIKNVFQWTESPIGFGKKELHRPPCMKEKWLGKQRGKGSKKGDWGWGLKVESYVSITHSLEAGKQYIEPADIVYERKPKMQNNKIQDKKTYFLLTQVVNLTWKWPSLRGDSLDYRIMSPGKMRYIRPCQEDGTSQGADTSYRYLESWSLVSISFILRSTSSILREIHKLGFCMLEDEIRMPLRPQRSECRHFLIIKSKIPR